MRSLSILLAAMLLLAGCASPDDDKTTEPTQDDHSGQDDHDDGQDDHDDDGGQDDDPDTGSDDDPAAPPAPDVPPSLNISASIVEAEVPYTTNVTIDISDEDSDDPSWIAYLEDVEVANGTGASYAEVDVTEVGESLLRVVARADGNSTEQNLSLIGIEPPPRYVEFTDSGDDGDIDMLDITKLELELTDVGLEATITLQDLTYPSERGTSLWWYTIYINEQRYDSGLGFDEDQAADEDHSDVYDYEDDDFLGYEYTTWDTDADTVWIQIPYTELEAKGLEAPYQVQVVSMFFPANQTEGTTERDVAPDDGPASIG